MTQSFTFTNQSPFDLVFAFFKEDEWNPVKVEGQTVLTTAFRGESGGGWRCLAVVDEAKFRFSFYSTLEAKAAPEQMAAVCEFISRANYGLLLGNFEMDHADGEIRYRTSLDYEGGQLVKEMVRTLVYANVLTVNRYFKGLMGVLYGDIAPAAAIAKSEQA